MAYWFESVHLCVLAVCGMMGQMEDPAPGLEISMPGCSTGEFVLRVVCKKFVRAVPGTTMELVSERFRDDEQSTSPRHVVVWVCASRAAHTAAEGIRRTYRGRNDSSLGHHRR